MARLARVVVADVAHHVTQRGNRREYILTSDAERLVYLDLVRQAVQLHPLSLIGYCLMSNHVHLIVIPHQSDALALAFKRAHGQYASYWNGGWPRLCPFYSVPYHAEGAPSFAERALLFLRAEQRVGLDYDRFFIQPATMISHAQRPAALPPYW